MSAVDVKYCTKVHFDVLVQLDYFHFLFFTNSDFYTENTWRVYKI